MLQSMNAETGILATLQPEFRRAIEASAANILLRIEPATATRLESLAALALSESETAETQAAAATAYALAAELTRRANMLRN